MKEIPSSKIVLNDQPGFRLKKAIFDGHRFNRKKSQSKAHGFRDQKRGFATGCFGTEDR